jgi:hypothetical protein
MHIVHPTFAQFRKVAKAEGWDLDYLLHAVGSQLDEPTKTLRRVLEGAHVDGHRCALHDGTWVPAYWTDMADVVLPYTCLLDLYDKATKPKSALAGERSCACGCKGVVRGKQQYASTACRVRHHRQTGHTRQRTQPAAP